MSVQRFNKNNGETQPTHIYYDMNLINNDSSFPAEPVRFNYKETRSNYYLLSPQDYYMSIVRFYLQTPSLPCFIPQINLNTNTNFGGTYPIQSMLTGTTNNSNPFTVNLYTNIPVVVGAVVFVGYSGGYLNARGSDVATGNNYYRVTASSTSSFGVTTLTLSNPNPVILSAGVYSLGTAIPSNYIGGSTTAFSVNGGTQNITYANISITTMSYSISTNILTLNTTVGNPFSLVGLFSVGDTIFINNSNQYNGTYVVTTVSASQLLLRSNHLASIPTNSLVPYVSGGSFTSAGDFYNITPYVISLQYTNAITMSFSVPVYYTSEDLKQTPPVWNPRNPQALSLTDLTADYYYVYTFNSVMGMINKALTNAFWGLNGYSYNNNQPAKPLPMSGTTVSTYQQPSISWNTSNATVVVTADNSAFAISNTYQPVYLFFNQSLSTLLASIPYVKPRVNPSNNLFAYINFQTSAGAGLYVVSTYSTVGAVTPQYTAIQQYQEVTTAGLFNPVSSIVFSSTLLPVNMENVGLPLILNGTSQNNIVVGSSANVFPIVTDFQVPVNATSSYTGDISYVPQSEYRLVDLSGTNPANQIDIQIYWKDQYGLIHPFYVGSGCSGSLKIMFRKKNFNNVSIDE